MISVTRSLSEKDEKNREQEMITGTAGGRTTAAKMRLEEENITEMGKKLGRIDKKGESYELKM